jgi:2-phosphosulfolactate phosphatase
MNDEEDRIMRLMEADDIAQCFLQSGFRCKLDWGREGARRAAAAGDILVVVDVLSFSTATATAIERGCVIIPCTDEEGAAAIADRTGAEAAVHRGKVPTAGRFSLSPLTYLDAEPGTRIALDSPNGATCSRAAHDVPHLFVGALVNADAVAGAVRAILNTSDHAVTVLACGERWIEPGQDGPLRFAIEDYCGAGAILASLPYEKSPEAKLCEMAFRAAKNDLTRIIAECGSGRELVAKGYGGDVEHASKLDIYTSVPWMRDGEIARIFDF